MAAPAPTDWADLVWSTAMPAVFGLLFLLGAGRVVAFIQGGLAWQRRNIPDPTIGLQERIVGSRAFLWFFRVVGAMLLLGTVIAAVEAYRGGGA